VYIRANHHPDGLMRIAHIGQATSNYLPMQENKAIAADALFSRAAETGWVNVIDNLAQWIEWGDAPAALQDYGLAHLAIPICDVHGAVLGLVTVSQSDTSQVSEEAQAWWVALAIALSHILPSYLPVDWLYQPPLDENE
jgi:predicted deacylase